MTVAIFLADPPDNVVITGSNGFVKTGEEVTIICTSSDAYPYPTVMIARGGPALETGFSPQSHTFTAVKADNGATFSCDASNSVDTVSAVLTFDVSCKFSYNNINISINFNSSLCI